MWIFWSHNDSVSWFKLVADLQQRTRLRFSISGNNKNLERSVGGVVRVCSIMAESGSRWLLRLVIQVAIRNLYDRCLSVYLLLHGGSFLTNNKEIMYIKITLNPFKFRHDTRLRLGRLGHRIVLTISPPRHSPKEYRVSECTSIAAAVLTLLELDA